MERAMLAPTSNRYVEKGRNNYYPVVGAAIGRPLKCFCIWGDDMPGDGMSAQMRELPYNREACVRYAHKWAYSRNDRYLDFEDIGGDCTNFASQCVYAGSGVMNYTPVYGWYYSSSYNRTASWTGVNYFYNFLVGNRGAGPYAEVVGVRDARPGDIAQLSFVGGGVYNHSPVIVQTGNPVRLDNILIAAHTFNADYYPLTNFTWVDIRFIHILGVRT